MTLGDRLKEWRARNSFSQRQAADVAGIKQSAWCAYETGASVPRADAIAKLIDAIPDLTLDMFAEAERDRRGPHESGDHPAVSVDPTGTEED